MEKHKIITLIVEYGLLYKYTVSLWNKSDLFVFYNFHSLFIKQVYKINDIAFQD